MQDLTTLMLLEKFKRRIEKVEKSSAEKGNEGPKGPKGDKGADGKQGPKGPKGPEGPKGPKGSEGPKGSDGKEGVDGENGVGIVDAYTAADGDLVFVMSDDSEVSVQMPLSTDENGQTIVYSQGGSSGEGGPMGPVTTSMVGTEPDVLFRDAKGRFKSVIVPELNNQLEVNRWFLDQIELLDNVYVNKKGGDSMEGPFNISGQQGMDSREARKLQTLGVFSNSENSALRLGTTRDRVYVGHNDTSFNGPIKVDEIEEKTDGHGIEIKHETSLNNQKIIELADPTGDQHAVTKSYVDNIATELEEEIDAIAPSVERGIWTFNLGGVVGNRGQLTMYDGMNGSGSPIGLFTNVKSVWLNELDNDGTPHGFANVNVGDLIELFVQGQSDYGLFTVVEVHDESEGAAQYWVIDVEFVRSLSATSKADNADDVRIKIIQPPSAGGDSVGLDVYLPIDGSKPMTGELEVYSRLAAKLPSDGTVFGEAKLLLEGYRDNASATSAKIAFSNAANPDAYVAIEFHGSNNANKHLWFTDKTVFNKGKQTAAEGFTLKGKIDGNDNGNLLSVYHNNSGLDAINYMGRQDSTTNLATVGFVNTATTRMASSKVLVDAFTELQEALSNETTVAGLKKALTTSLAGLIKTLETEN